MKKILLCLLCVSACQRAPLEESLISIHIQDRNGLEETISSPDRLQAWEAIDFLSPQPYKKIFRMFKTEGRHHSKITTYHPNGSPWQYLEVQEMRAMGRFQEWFANGQLKIDAAVLGGTADVSPGAQKTWLFDGVSSVWDEVGMLVAQIPYVKGVLSGLSMYYYASGQVQQELPFHNGHLHGAALTYWDNGDVRSKTEYVQGVRSGLSVGFWTQTRPMWIEEYTQGRLERGIYYNVLGAEQAEVYQGNGFQALFEGGRLVQKIEFRKGIPEGLVQCFSPTGELEVTYLMKQGKKQGEERLYFPSGEVNAHDGSPVLKMSLQWEEDAIHGLVKTWYPHGVLKTQSEWIKNQKNGSSCAWYCDGSMALIEEYQQGELIEGHYFRRGQKDPISRVIQGQGVATLYDEEGLFLKKVSYQNRVPLVD